MKKDMKTLQIPTELYDALGMKKNDTMEMFSPEDGTLVIRVTHDTGDFVCNRDCDNCPFGDDEASCEFLGECDEECEGCPYACPECGECLREHIENMLNGVDDYE